MSTQGWERQGSGLGSLKLAALTVPGVTEALALHSHKGLKGSPFHCRVPWPVAD